MNRHLIETPVCEWTTRRLFDSPTAVEAASSTSIPRTALRLCSEKRALIIVSWIDSIERRCYAGVTSLQESQGHVLIDEKDLSILYKAKLSFIDQNGHIAEQTFFLLYGKD